MNHLVLDLFCCYCSVAKSCPALCHSMDCIMPGFPVLQYLLEFAQTRVHWVGDAIQPLSFSVTLCSPPSSSVTPFSCPQSCPASGAFPMSQLFASGGQSIGASASVLPNEYSGLISFRIDWFDLLAVQGALKSLFQNHSSKASILWRSAFFMVQLSHPYVFYGMSS